MQKIELARRNRFLEKARTFIAALPLAAALITGCADSKNECRTYNETTVTLNQQTDGKSVGVKDLEKLPSGNFLTGPQIDFINEAHALSSQGMPDDVKATQVPMQCSVSDDVNKPKAGYTQPVSSDGLERGVYIPENPELNPISLINLVNHEIGHLQPGNPPNGFEVISQLNEYEGQMTGFALLALQGDIGLTRWQSHMVHPSLLRRLVLALESGRGVEGNPFDAYDRANMFIFNGLVELDGDFKALRGQIGQLVRNEGHGGALMDAALDDAIARFQSGNISNADLFISIRIRMLSELERRFGLGASYFNANSRLLDAALVFGLDGLNCAYVIQPAPDVYDACSDPVCTDLGANARLAVDYSLCCLGMDDSGFSKWSVNANGVKYRNDTGMLSIDGFEWGTATYLTTATRMSLSINEPCG